MTRIPGRGVFLIQGERRSAFMLALPDGRDTSESPRLVFNRYGDRYFLREIRMGDNTGFELPMSRDERQAEEQIASLSAPEIVIVHANGQ